jgi:hypothetical protein
MSFHTISSSQEVTGSTSTLQVASSHLQHSYYVIAGHPGRTSRSPGWKPETARGGVTTCFLFLEGEFFLFYLFYHIRVDYPLEGDFNYCIFSGESTQFDLKPFYRRFF